MGFSLEITLHLLCYSIGFHILIMNGSITTTTRTTMTSTIVSIFIITIFTTTIVKIMALYFIISLRRA